MWWWRWWWLLQYTCKIMMRMMIFSLYLLWDDGASDEGDDDYNIVVARWWFSCTWLSYSTGNIILPAILVCHSFSVHLLFISVLSILLCISLSNNKERLYSVCFSLVRHSVYFSLIMCSVSFSIVRCSAYFSLVMLCNNTVCWWFDHPHGDSNECIGNYVTLHWFVIQMCFF